LTQWYKTIELFDYINAKWRPYYNKMPCNHPPRCKLRHIRSRALKKKVVKPVFWQNVKSTFFAILINIFNVFKSYLLSKWSLISHFRVCTECAKHFATIWRYSIICHAIGANYLNINNNFYSYKYQAVPGCLEVCAKLIMHPVSL